MLRATVTASQVMCARLRLPRRVRRSAPVGRPVSVIQLWAVAAGQNSAQRERSVGRLNAYYSNLSSSVVVNIVLVLSLHTVVHVTTPCLTRANTPLSAPPLHTVLGSRVGYMYYLSGWLLL